MSKKRRFQMIANTRGSGRLYERATAVIADPDREFGSSDYAGLEALPKPVDVKREAEVHFYKEFFASATSWYSFDGAHLDAAFREACDAGLSALDAVHVILAELAGCEELVTPEKASGAIHRTKRVRVVSIDTD